jgi:hypothetical protein
MVDVLRSINKSLLYTSQISHENRMSNRNLGSIVTSRCVILVRVINLLTILMRENRIEQFLDESKA